jgi:hypothetical protein
MFSPPDCNTVRAGYAVTGTEVRTVAVVFDKGGQLDVTAGRFHCGGLDIWVVVPS